MGADTRSALVGIEHPDALEVRAIDLTSGSSTFPLLDQYIGQYEVRLTVVEYRASLEALTIPAGPIPPATSGTPIPGGHERIRETLVRGDDVGAWEDRDMVGGRLATFRMAGDTTDDCIDDGGCFDADVAGGQVCQNPCPTTEPPPAPTPPAAPTITCPVGWSNVTVADTTVCTPFAGGVPTCPPFAAVVPGETDCRVPGPACPAGEWPEGLTGDVVYVRPGATGGGTQQSPVGTIAAAVGMAGPSATIALSKGTHTGDVTLPSGLTIAGACASETHVQTTGVDAVFSIAGGSRVTIRDLHLSGAREGIEVDGTGSTLTLRGVAITDTGRAALDVGTGGHVDAEDVVVGPNTVRGLRVIGGTADVRRTVFDRAVRLGVYVQNAGAEARLTDVAIVDTLPDPDDGDQFGRAIDVERGGRLIAERVFATRAHNLAIFVSDESYVSLTDGVVQDTQSRADNGSFGDALHILRGGQAELSRVWLDRNRRFQVFATGETATATLTDVVISRSLAEENGGEGSAVRAYSTGRIHLRRAAIDTTRVASIIARDEGSLVTLEDVRITGAGMAPDSTGSNSALRAETGGTLELTRVRIEGTAGRAVAIEKDSRAIVDHLSVDDAGSATCLVCAGLCADDQGSFDARDVEITGAYGRAVAVSDLGSTGSVERLTVRRSFPAPSCTTGFRSPLLGDGAGTVDGGRLQITNFLIEDQPGAGLVVEDYINASTVDSGLYATDGTVMSCSVGANVFVADYPLVRVSNRVRYVDNESNLNFSLER